MWRTDYGLSDESRAHPVFHVSLLKKVISRGQQSQELPKGLENDFLSFEPSKVFVTRFKRTCNEEKLLRYLLNFLTLALFSGAQFPNVSLADKANVLAAWKII